MNRHSPPEVVANFKRRVPPRLPKPRKRDPSEQSIPPPRSAVGLSPIDSPLSGSPGGKLTPVGRSRGFSAPSPYQAPGQGQAPGNGNANGPNTWNGNYTRSPIPPLTVPNPPHMSQSPMYGHSPHHLQPISPAEESPSYHHMPPYGNEGGYSYSNGNNTAEPTQWNSYSASGAPAGPNGGSLSALLNPSAQHPNGPPPPNGYNSRPTPTINTSYGTQFSHLPVEHSASSPVSPDSRPNTGYSVHSSMPYRGEDQHMSPVAGYDSRPGSSHHRGHSPGAQRPPSSSSPYPPSSTLPIRRPRRHSQAANPYPSPYENGSGNDRPETPQDGPDSQQGYSPELTASGSISRVRSMIQLPSVDQYGLANSQHQSQPQFAFNAGMDAVPENNGGGDWRGAPAAASGARPSTGASTISAASTGSQANTPPFQEGGPEAKINRC